MRGKAPTIPAHMRCQSLAEAGYGNTARLFNALANPLRIQILVLLGGPGRNVEWIRKTIGCRQQIISGHLTVLKRYGLATFRRAEKSNVYSLTDEGVSALALVRIARGTHEAYRPSPGVPDPPGASPWIPPRTPITPKRLAK